MFPIATDWEIMHKHITAISPQNALLNIGNFDYEISQLILKTFQRKVMDWTAREMLGPLRGLACLWRGGGATSASGASVSTRQRVLRIVCLPCFPADVGSQQVT